MEVKPALSNWGYTDPPVLRNGRLGANWRHLAQCYAQSGGHVMFIDGMVKQVDGLRYPPFGSKDPLPVGIPPTTHSPKLQLKMHGQYAQQKLPRPQTSLELGRGGRHEHEEEYDDVDYTGDAGQWNDEQLIEIYQMGVQHGMNLGQKNLDEAFIGEQQQAQDKALEQCKKCKGFRERPTSAPRPVRPTRQAPLRPAPAATDILKLPPAQAYIKKAAGKKPNPPYSYKKPLPYTDSIHSLAAFRKLATMRNLNALPATTLEPYTY